MKKPEEKDSELLDNFIDELESGKKYISKKAQHASQDVEKIFSDLSTEKIGSLKEAIEDIQQLIITRQKLNEEINIDIDKLKMDIDNFILKFGDDTTRAEQLNLKKKQVELEEIKIQEKVNAWRDIANLKKELRERIKEFREKESSATMLDKILKE